MAHSGFVRLGGFASLLGGVLWVVALAAAQLRGPQLAGIVAIPSLCLILGVAAIRVRGATRPGLSSALGLPLALLGGVLLAYGSTGSLVFGGDVAGIGYGPFLFTGVAFGALVLGLGAAVLAISMIAADVLPRLSPIPLLVGAAGVAISGGLGLVRQLQQGPAHDVFPIDAPPLLALWAIFGLGWLWLGYLLFSERTRPIAEAAESGAPGASVRGDPLRPGTAAR
jgi:hypothetical protein